MGRLGLGPAAGLAAGMSIGVRASDSRNRNQALQQEMTMRQVEKTKGMLDQGLQQLGNAIKEAPHPGPAVDSLREEMLGGIMAVVDGLERIDPRTAAYYRQQVPLVASRFKTKAEVANDAAQASQADYQRKLDFAYGGQSQQQPTPQVPSNGPLPEAPPGAPGQPMQPQMYGEQAPDQGVAPEPTFQEGAPPPPGLEQPIQEPQAPLAQTAQASNPYGMSKEEALERRLGHAGLLTKSDEARGEAVAKASQVSQGKVFEALNSLPELNRLTGILKEGIISGMGADTRLAAFKTAMLTGKLSKEDEALVIRTEDYKSGIITFATKLLQEFGAGTGLSDADFLNALKASAGDVGMETDAMISVLENLKVMKLQIGYDYNAQFPRFKMDLPPKGKSISSPISLSAADVQAAKKYVEDNPGMKAADYAKLWSDLSEKQLGTPAQSGAQAGDIEGGYRYTGNGPRKDPSFWELVE